MNFISVSLPAAHGGCRARIGERARETAKHDPPGDCACRPARVEKVFKPRLQIGCRRVSSSQITEQNF